MASTAGSASGGPNFLKTTFIATMVLWSNLLPTPSVRRLKLVKIGQRAVAAISDEVDQLIEAD
jgi:hypothetical protein